VEAGCAADVYAFGVIMFEVLKQELVVADIAVKADLEDMDDENALRQFVSSVAQGERCASCLLELFVVRRKVSKGHHAMLVG
jgi:hypothetical protein